MARVTVWVSMMVMAATMFGAALAADRVTSRNGVPLVSGGVGLDSQQRLKALEPDFNLKLVFTLTEGNYLSDVAVSIRDTQGKEVVVHVAEGPFMLVKLPAGKYSVHAVYGGKPRMQTVVVSGGALPSITIQTVYLRWAANPASDFALPPEHLQRN